GAGQFTFVGRQPVTFQGIERLTPGATISGVVFGDANGNGTRDPGESGAGGFFVNLDGNGDGAPDAARIAGSDGSYAFTDLTPGTYTVFETPSSSAPQTFPPPPGTYTVNAANGGNFPNRDFGNMVSGVLGIGARIVFDLFKTVDPNLAANIEAQLNTGTPRG